MRQPDRFDFENAGSWPAWLSLFDDYGFSGLSQATGEAKVRTLLYCKGPEARPRLSTFGLDENFSDYAAVVAKFTAHFDHPLDEVYESPQLHRRVKEPREAIDTYYAELCKLAKRRDHPSAEI